MYPGMDDVAVERTKPAYAAEPYQMTNHTTIRRRPSTQICVDDGGRAGVAIRGRSDLFSQGVDGRRDETASFIATGPQTQQPP
jgi:hypothetical protein